MPLLVTEAIVLHVADYLESSRILRLATREAGVQSVVARGARNSRKRFGSAIDLFAQGQAQLDIRPGRDLHALVSFDVARSHPGLAEHLARFSAASAFAEVALRVVHEEAAPLVFEGLAHAFADMASRDGDAATAVALGALWRLVRDTGFSPSLDRCAECHAEVSVSEEAIFSYQAGGILCGRCAARTPGGRRLPAAARRVVVGWLNDDYAELSSIDAKAHQRLLREFIGHHLTDGRPLRAFASWESGGLAADRLHSAP
ncbi:MAG: DNA repair protein RecO [Gemmatimonadaceae bacterium]|nr:DNA repair protein RecO [Gemmatimonadaceae bacterium]